MSYETATLGYHPTRVLRKVRYRFVVHPTAFLVRWPTCLRRCYGMSGTEVGAVCRCTRLKEKSCSAMQSSVALISLCAVRYCHTPCTCYAAMRCLVLTYAMRLLCCYALSGTDIRHAPAVLLCAVRY
eukprot:3477873-Rhodomonas_salina.7